MCTVVYIHDPQAVLSIFICATPKQYRSLHFFIGSVASSGRQDTLLCSIFLHLCLEMWCKSNDILQTLPQSRRMPGSAGLWFSSWFFFFFFYQTFCQMYFLFILILLYHESYWYWFIAQPRVCLYASKLLINTWVIIAYPLSSDLSLLKEEHSTARRELEEMSTELQWWVVKRVVVAVLLHCNILRVYGSFPPVKH